MQSIETIKKRSEKIKGRPRLDLRGSRGFKHTDASKVKMSEALRQAWQRRKVIQAQ
jgi:hypothetical protein